MLVPPVKTVEKPWGSEFWIAVTEQYALKIITFKAGQRGSLQYHEKKLEHIYIDAGRAKVEFAGPDGKLVTQICGPGTILEVKPGDLHRMEALEDLRLIEVSMPLLDDVVRVADDYGREPGQ